MRPYEDRDHCYKYHSRHHYYEHMAKDYEHYFQAQLARADRAVAILRQVGVEYDANRDMYIRISDGSALWT